MVLSTRFIPNHEWVIALIIFILVLLVIVKWNKINYFLNFTKSPLDSSYFTKKFAEKRRIELPEILLFFSSLLGISFFINVYLFEDVFELISYFQIILLVFVFILGKYFIEKIIGDVFEINSLVNKYLFFKQSILSWLSLFFLFPIGLLVYFQSLNQPILLSSCILISILIYALKILNFSFAYQKHILTYWFYFIVYLCIFEIGPILILVKSIKIS